MSDMYPYKSVPGSNRTEGTSHEALAIPDNFQSRPDFPSQRVLRSLYRGPVGAETFDELSFRFQKYPVFTTGLQMLSIYVVSLFGMGYTTQRSFPS